MSPIEARVKNYLIQAKSVGQRIPGYKLLSMLYDVFGEVLRPDLATPHVIPSAKKSLNVDQSARNDAGQANVLRAVRSYIEAQEKRGQIIPSQGFFEPNYSFRWKHPCGALFSIQLVNNMYWYARKTRRGIRYDKAIAHYGRLTLAKMTEVTDQIVLSWD